jgi:nitrite reductase (NO-forming)
MKPDNTLRLPPIRALGNPVFVVAVAAGLVALSLPRVAPACEVCNTKFAEQLTGARADSLVARDLLAAIENQRHLPLAELGSAAFAAEARALAAADTAPAPGLPPVNRSGSLPGGSAVAPPASGPVVAPPAGPLDPRFRHMLAAPYDTVPEAWRSDPFIEIIDRDYSLPIPATSYVPQETTPDKSFTIELSEGKTYIGNGVMYDGFLTNGTIPGPLFVVDEGDIVEMTVVNNGTIPHGASIHSAYTQTSKYLGKIQPGSSGRVVFRCTQPGVFLYHCAPGGHAIPMHVLFGQYGMMVVKPKKKAFVMDEIMGRKPDLELYLVQHEFYASGRDSIEGRALYTTFNGKLFRYVEEPITARPGDFVRIYFLNVGPNLISTFHIVGICWDYVYWQGNPAAVLPGGQSVLAGPTDSWVIDFRVPPDEGAYTMLTHAVGSASRGAIGLLVADRNAETPAMISPEGIRYSPEEIAEHESKARRTISPFKPTNVDEVVRHPPGTREVTVSIIGNSYSPKVVEVEPGTTVRWVNEDVFTYLAGEFAGIHNAQYVGDREDGFNLPLLAHGESGTHLFESEGEFEYMCTPHPYMRGKVIVKKPVIDIDDLSGGAGFLTAGWLLPMAGGAFLVALISLYLALSRRSG